MYINCNFGINRFNFGKTLTCKKNIIATKYQTIDICKYRYF